MNELQLALLGAGVGAVALVWLYNALQERKHRKRADAVFKIVQEDVLVGKTTVREPSFSDEHPVEDALSNRREPGLSEPSEPLEDACNLTARGLDPNLDPVLAPVNAPTSGSRELHPAAVVSPEVAERGDSNVPPAPESKTETGPDDLLPWVDLLADCVVTFSLASPVTVAGLWAAQSSWKGGIGKPINLLACPDARGAWTHVGENSPERSSHWMVGLQLVDRSGPVSDTGLARFIDGLQQIGRHVGVDIPLPARSDVLMRAQDLDRFCASVDIQFSLSVVSAQSGPFAGTKLRGVCEAAGLTLENDGLYHYRNAAGECEFTLGNLGNESFDVTAMSSLATHGVSLTIDVPRVTDGVAAFNRMVLVARQLAQGLGGTLVDAHRVALADVVIAGIRSKIGEVQQVLHTAGIIPGSPRALRLFS